MLSEIRRNSAGMDVLVAGDLNFDVSREPMASLIADTELHFPLIALGGRPTTRSRHHGKCAAIDWILAGRSLVATSPEVHDAISASDHYPISLEVQLGAGHNP
jgi:endonuclease/exonuclease/phosphatase family metal-dependent hydrolase